MRTGKGTDSQLKVCEALAELLGPALEDARLALHAPDRDLVELGEGLQRRPDVFGKTVEGADDEFAKRELAQDGEVGDEVVFVGPFGTVVAPREPFQIHAEAECFSAVCDEVRAVESDGT